MKKAPTNPTETANEFPFAAIYLLNGNLGAGPIGTRKSLYNIAIDVLVPRKSLADDLALLDPFIDSVPAALVAEVSENGQKFNKTISNFESVSILYIVVDYAAVPMRGYRFTMENVKILSNT